MRLTVDEAIAAIEECRASHQIWIDNACYLNDPHAVRIGGNLDHHRKWVEKYNGVLEVLHDFKDRNERLARAYGA